MAFLLGLVSLVMLALPSSAHNGERTSDPEDGATLSVAPKTITFWFKQAVGQDRLTLLLIDPTGSRKPLTILKTEEFQAVAALPPLTNGVYSVRWKLLSSDGHPVTNKVSFTVAVKTQDIGAPTTLAPTSVLPTTLAPTTVLPTSAGAASDTTLSTTPSNGRATRTTSTASAVPISAQILDDDLSTAAPNWVRWLLRYVSYLAIFVVVGFAATSIGVWTHAFAHPILRRAAIIANLVIAVLALLQIAVLTSDIGSKTWSDSLRQVPSFDVGISLIVRVALALACAVLLRVRRRQARELAALAVLSAGMLITWSFAGHAKSQGLAWLAVPADALHHAAGAAWLGSLVIVGFVARAAVKDSTYGELQRRMSAFAFAAVAVLSVTGLAQSIRLVGLSRANIASTHTTLLGAKVLVVGAMLFLGNRNRLRLNRSTVGTSPPDLRRSVVAEFGLGLIVLAITSSLVVASPSSNNTSPTARQTTTPQGETR